MYCDCHLHTCFSSDSEAPVKEQIEKAVALKMPAMCITDHQDLDFPPGELTFQFDTADYFHALRPLQEEYSSRIDLRIGVELGIQPHLRKELADYVAAWPDYDFIIGSTHLVSRVDPYEEEYWEGRTAKDGVHAYLEEVLENLYTFHDFDTLGHLDYVVRYGKAKKEPYNWKDHEELIEEILRFLIRKDICLECNTAGLKAGLGHPNPTEGILRRYLELGGCGITLGSDAHRSEHVGFAFDVIGETLKSCGAREYITFRGRKPEIRPL